MMIPTNRIEPVTLLPCPFCGKAANIEDDDTLYPSGIGWKSDGDLGRTYHNYRQVPKEQRCWSMHCPEVAGGCGAEISGDSRYEAIAKWNKRIIPAGYAIVPVEQVKDADLALGEAVAVLYFDDSSDYSAALWTIVEKLGGKAAYDLLMENGAEAYAKYSAAKGE